MCPLQSTCGVVTPQGTCGDGFNHNKGGVRAIQLEETQIRMWLFRRKDIPCDITSEKPDLDSSGTPLMNFGPGNCSIASSWKNMKMTFDLNFCGQDDISDWRWQQSKWPQNMTCSEKTNVSTCKEQVEKNPQAFSEAYFLIQYIKVFQMP
ncbi:hypothetical protein EJ04DRAFT_586278 [Polyplosphaeria fusca]|uniref:Uncharacterized protein n=1 Tax=Polyplosphaeria fusca TaxID=682080 RepID=A0A9P4UVY4_9PLEO|nr:hypothetical protein EJ04DRAFT_586278 [Polyplosphaeria fusca]